jgi:hypothetical protein
MIAAVEEASMLAQISFIALVLLTVGGGQGSSRQRRATVKPPTLPIFDADVAPKQLVSPIPFPNQARMPLDWRDLEPVRPALDPSVLALSDKDRDALFGPVKVVRDTYEFLPAEEPVVWHPEWANRPESHYTRFITYDREGKRVNTEYRGGMCVNRSPDKEVYDDRGRRVELISYSNTMDGTILSHSYFSYDNNGWLTDVTTYGPDESIQSRWVYRYEVDSHGNWIAQIPVCVEGCPIQGKYRVLAVMCRSLSYYE